MPATLYAVPASHPSRAVEAAFALKGVPLERTDLPPPLHNLLLLARFGSPTAPAVRFADGTEVSGSRAILRALDRRVKEPPLYPREPDRRLDVEIAERWGEETLQPLARRLLWAALARRPSALAAYADGARLALPVPAPVLRALAPGLAAAMRRLRSAGDADVKADRIGLAGHLDRVDRWIAHGTLGGEAPNAADLQIGASLRLLLTLGDVAPEIDRRPAGALARRLFADQPGEVPAGVLPSP